MSKAGLKVLGLIKGESEDFDQLVDQLLKNMPAPTDYQGHTCACDIGTAIYEALKAAKEESK